MEHFARWVVRHRKAVLAAAVLLLIPSVFGAAGTYINYDILTYLPPELDSMVGEGYLEDDFNMASTSMITVENMSTADTLALKSELEAVAGVKSVLWTSDILDVTTPKEMLPADIQKFFYSENGATLLLVQFENPSAHAVTMQAQRTIKDILRKDCFIYYSTLTVGQFDPRHRLPQKFKGSVEQWNILRAGWCGTAKRCWRPPCCC